MSPSAHSVSVRSQPCSKPRASEECHPPLSPRPQLQPGCPKPAAVSPPGKPGAGQAGGRRGAAGGRSSEMPPGSQRTTRPTRRVRVRRASCPRMCRNVPEIPSTPGSPLPSVLGLPDRSWKMGVSLAPRSCWGGGGQTPGSPPDPAPLKGSPRRSPTLMPLGPAGAPSAGRGHAAPARRWAECPLCFQDLCSPGDEARHPGPPRQTRPRLTPCSGSKGLPLGGGRAGGEPRGETPLCPEAQRRAS